jgi:hypothetical protein
MRGWARPLEHAPFGSSVADIGYGSLNPPNQPVKQTLSCAGQQY